MATRAATGNPKHRTPTFCNGNQTCADTPERLISREHYQRLIGGLLLLGHYQCLDDALTCVLIAWLFHCQSEQLVQPNPGVDLGEGWIFVPADGLGPGQESKADVSAVE